MPRPAELNDHEKAQVRDLIKALEQRAKLPWQRKHIAQALGYRSQSIITGIMEDEKGIPRLRFDALKLLVETDAEPGTILIDASEKGLDNFSPRSSGRQTMLVDTKTAQVAMGLYQLLLDRGVRREDVAIACGYSTPEGLFSALKQERLPLEVWDSLRSFAESDTVKRLSAESGQMPPTVKMPMAKPPTLPRGGSALDYGNAAVTSFRQGITILQRGIEEGAFKELLAPGIRTAALRIDDWVKKLEELFA